MNLNLNKFWKKRSVTITEYDPTYKVVYLGNVLTAWAKGDGCVDKPLATLWKNYCQNTKPDVLMKVTVCNSGLKAVTKEHGLTEYWSNRVTYSAALVQYSKVFCWVYRHEGKKLRQELRCHAVLCHKEEVARRMAAQLQAKLALALQEFRREKISRQNARLSLANSVYDNPSLPRRKILLCTGSSNYRPPLERSKSAPKLMVIEEAISEAPEDRDATTNMKDDAADLDNSNQRQLPFGGHCPKSTDTANAGLHQQEHRCHHGSYPGPLRPPIYRWHEFPGPDQCNDYRHRHRLRLMTDPLDEEEDNDDQLASELDDIEVCFDPMEPDGSLDVGGADEDDALMYNSNPNGQSGLPSPLAPVSEDVTSCESSSEESASSSPASLRQTAIDKADDDTVSDESGYSEENGVALMRNGLCDCAS